MQTAQLLIATLFIGKCPVYFAPAMDLDMYTSINDQQLRIT
jgi:hypothetical protein